MKTTWGRGNDGLITDNREYIFTEWDPTATSDMEALRAVFDTNSDGVLTEADARFAEFKIMVTNADGSTTARTLTELGITSINLTADATNITLADGSMITGQAQFTRVVGGVASTSIVGDVTLVAESDGNRVTQQVSTDSNGNRVVVSNSYDASGDLAYRITSTSNPAGTLITNKYDDNGDGVDDRIQTITTATDALGVKTETLVNYAGNDIATAVLVNQQVTSTSSDGKSVSIQRDSTGGGWFDQVETRSTASDGTRSIVTNNFARDGVTLINSSTEGLNATGLSRSNAIDLDGLGQTDLTQSQTIVVAGTGERTNGRSSVYRRNTSEQLSTRRACGIAIRMAA